MIGSIDRVRNAGSAFFTDLLILAEVAFFRKVVWGRWSLCSSGVEPITGDFAMKRPCGLAVARGLERLVDPGTVAGLTEPQLLARFAERRDPVAFEAIVPDMARWFFPFAARCFATTTTWTMLSRRPS